MSSTRRRRDALTGYALLAPSLIGVGVFLVVPVILVLALSLTRWDLISPITFIGLDNYAFLATDARFGNSMFVTLVFTAVAVPLSMAFGLIIALLLNRKMPGTGAIRVLYVLPWVCAPLILGVVWKWILAPTYGALNAILGMRIEWLTDLNLALPSVIVVYVWTQVGYLSLFFLAGLQNIPISVYEAARLDGANAWLILRKMTLPLLRPTTFFVAVTSMIASFQVFDMIYALTGGGPAGRTDVIAARIYSEAFVAQRFGRGAAIAVVLFLVIVAVTLLQQRYFAKRITYDMA